MSILPRPVARATKYVIGERNKKNLQYAVLRARQAVGIEPFTGWNGLDRKLLDYLPDRPGFFIEAGGNDGFTQSNTYYLERCRSWRGLLVEPIAELADFARKIRTATVHQCALGGPEDAGNEIGLSFSDLTSSVDGVRPVRWNGIFGRNPSRGTAVVRTLSSLIEEAGNPEVDLLSLDVEGFELAVLAGLNLRRHAPGLILVETADANAVASVLLEKYVLRAQLSHHDYLFARN